MEYVAVIDTETNWDDEVMSIGVVIADKQSLRPIDKRYYVIEPAYKVGGMYVYALNRKGEATIVCARKNAIENMLATFEKYNVNFLFAYNANFDYCHLPELRQFIWYDIMKMAAYKQYNHAIPATAVCCSTGRLKSGYGVESIMRMLKGADVYVESHNALFDAYDELEIMRLLKIDVNLYKKLKEI